MAKGRGGGKTPERLVELLKKAVEEKSQSAVSKETGLGLATINSYLKGIGEPTAATLKKFAEYFDVPVDYLTENPIMEMLLNAGMPIVSQKYPEASRIEQHKLILKALPEIMDKVFKELMANTKASEGKSSR